MKDPELTQKIKEWLDTEPAKRDLDAGAEMLLRVTRNRILYANITRNPKAKAAHLEYQLQKVLKNRLLEVTHEQVQQMMVKVDAIAENRGLSPQSARSPFQRGKRADHDELPDEVKQLYVDNADIMRRMREAHTRLRMITPLNSSCPDSDRMTYAKAIIEYDAKYRDNWNVYDHYVKGTPISATVKEVDPRTAQKNAAKTLNLLLGKYAKAPTEAAAQRIKDLYAQVASPSDTLRAKMAAAKLL